MAAPVNASTSRQKVICQKSEDIQDRWEQVLAGDTSGFEIFHVEGIGRSIRTTRAFKQNEILMRYFGEVISPQEALRRDAAGPQVGHFYRYDFEVKDKKYVLDATPDDGTYGRLISHSRKNPNVLPKPVEIDGCPAIIFKAMKDIAAGEELCYDYGEHHKDVIQANPWLKK